MASLKTFLLFVLTLFAAAIIAQPSNDHCADAIPIVVGEECTTADYTSIASTSEDVSVAANPTCGFYSGGDVWFTFTVPASGNFKIELAGNEWALYSGTCGGFTEIRCEGNNHNFREPSLAGQTLYLRAFRWNNDQGADFSVCIWEFDPQPNDYCADAINLPVGQDCTLQDFTTLYTTSESADVAENPTCGFYKGGDVWFTFTAPASGNFRIELDGNEWALYSGTCGDFTEIRCEGNNHNFREPSLAGQTLYLRAFRWNNDQGADFSVCVWEFDPQPNDYCADAINIPVGQDCTLQNFSTLYTTSESSDIAENPTCGFYSGGDVWFTFTVPASGDFRVNLDGNEWELYSGTCGNFTQIRCDGGAHNFRQPDLAGQTLYLRAFRWNNDQGSDFELCVWEPEMQPNDHCADAINIEVGQICTEQDFSSQYATAETEDIAPNPTCGFYSGGDVWFTFTVPASGDFRVELDDNEWELYSGSCGNFTQIGCYSGDWNFSDPTLGGETIYLRAFRWNNKQGAEFSLCIWEIDVPENNLCSNATNIILNDSCATQSFSSRYSTAEDASVAENPGCGFYSGGDVWFTFTAPESGQFALEKTANTNGGSTQFAFYTGSCGDFEEFHCAGSSEISFNDPTLGGELITVRAFSWNNRQGADFDICIKNTTIAPNDMCANPMPLDVGESCTFETFNNFNTTSEEGIAPDPTCGFYSGGDVWFTFEVPSTGQFQINRNNISGGSYNYAIYTGTCGAFELYDCSTDPTQSLYDAIELANQTVYLRVYRWNSSYGGEFELCVVAGDCSGELGGTSYIDECGNCVGGNTGLEPCVQDCNGVYGGTAYIDNCETCVGGNTGLTACVADCHGDFGGTAYLDNCEICVGGETGVEPCTQDCNGDFGGTAYLDNCDTCVGGNTGIDPCETDCNGVYGGTAYLDNCGICVGGTTELAPCTADCNGDFGGTAYLDNCETCVGGNTELEPCEADCNGDFGGTAYLDNCETCVGGNTELDPCEADCNGDFGGTAFLDNCETCVGGNTELDPCEADCNGDFGGTAYLDNCETCVGGNTELEPCEADCNGDFGGTAYLDNCETCVGGNTELEPCTADCNGDFGGTAYLDNCEACVGGNTELDPCTADCNGDFGGTAYLDNCETCVGGNTELEPCEADCNGDFGGTAYLDNCETCVGGNTELEPCEADCNGDFGGTAYLDNCETCVGGNTELDPCEADCNGDFGGTAYLDNCETCVGGNTELDPCEADCNGDFGGTAYLDNCETCVGGNTELEPCTADCNGDFGGTAYLDNCETCVGGNTELEPCEADCNGDFGGTAYLDNCETCVGGNTELEPCTADCNGDFGGTAYLDNCETCVGGNTELEPCEADCNGDFGGTAYLDNCETCVGGNTELDPCTADCNGDFGGTAYLDNCETCVGGNTELEPCTADCNGDFGGTAYLDNCETCVGGNTELEPCTADCNGDFGGTAYLDNCETCVEGNTGLEACVADCNGDFGGTAFVDDCNICAGGNTGITPCSYDCLELEANIGDSCDDNDPTTSNDVINEDCECAGSVAYDCPELEANYGDACDDGNPETTIDMINADCQCQGIIVYDCEEIEANIGDSCDDGDTATTNDMITADCGCEGTIVNPTVCQEFVYYLADYTAQTGTSIYEVHLNGGIAELTFLTQIPDEVHLAYNNEHNLIYAVRKLNNSYYTLNPHVDSPVFTGPVYLSGNYGQITGAAFSEDGDLLIASQNTNKVFSINVMDNSGSVYDEYAPIRGGDIAFNSNGVLFLASSTAGGGLYEVHPQSESSDILLGELSKLNTGLAITDSDELLLSERNSSSLAVYTTSGSSAGGYDLMLDGEVFTLNYGDMASGCNTYEEPNPGDCSDFSTFFAQYDAGQHETTVYGVTFSGSDANLTAIVTVADEMHIAFRAELNTLFLISKTGSYFREYALYSDDLGAETQLNLSLHSITGADFNEVDGLLYIADANSDIVYSVDTETGFTSNYMSADVNGGDLAILQDGTIYLATQSGNTLFDLNSDPSPTYIGGIPSKVTGLARANSASGLIMSNYKSNVFVELSANDASTITAYNAKLDGESFMLMYGDMASGCIDVQRPTMALKTNPWKDINQTSEKTMLSSHPNPTSGASEVIFTSAYNAQTLVEIYDMNGRNVATIFDENAQKGKEYRLDFNGQALPNGVYIYRLTNNQETIIEKFMIAH